MNGAQKSPKLLLVDGSNLLFQMFYGMPSRILGKSGKPIHGTLGFCGALLKILRLVSPTHVLILFDGEHKNARAELDPAYKANRTNFSDMPEEETPFSQLPDIYALLKYLGIRHYETEREEADDVIASYVGTYEKEIEIVIASWDSDLFQLIGDRVSVLRYRGEKTRIWKTADILEKFGILPHQYADWKALVGDASDNIKGAPGIGPKTAAQLLNTYRSLPELLSHAHALKRPSHRLALAQNAEKIITNYKIIKLSPASAIPLPISALAYRSDATVTTRQCLADLQLF